MNLSYICTGQGETIIFIHSYLWDKNMWQPQIDFLKNKYKCISIDLPGHGDSPLLEANENIDLKTLAKKIVVFLNDMNIEKYIFVGLSVGGMLAPYIYELDKKRIKKMIIMDSYTGNEPDKSKNLYFSMLDTILSLKKIPESMAEKIAPMFFSPATSQKKTKLYKEFYNSLVNTPADKIETIVKLGKAIFGRENSHNLLQKIDVPVIFITGENDIPRPFNEAKEMSMLVKNSKLFSVKNAGHISNLENPDIVNSIFKDIL